MDDFFSVRLPIFCKQSVFYEKYPVRVFGDILLVRDEHDGAPEFFVELLECAEHYLACLGIQIACGLVGKNERRIVHQRAGDGDALYLPTGNLIGKMQKVSFIQPGGDERFFGAAFPFFRRYAFIDEWEHDIPEHRSARQEIECLKDEAYLVPPDIGKLIVGERRDILAVQKILAASGIIQRAEDVHEGGFSGAGRTHDCHEFAVRYGEADTFQCLEFHIAGLIYLGDVFYFNHISLL